VVAYVSVLCITERAKPLWYNEFLIAVRMTREVFMSISELFGQSAILTVMGMAVVFLFLWILIACVKLASKLITASEGRKANSTTSGPQALETTDPQILAVISAAVAEYQHTHQ